MSNKKKLIAISAPSGGGKSVVTRHIMKLYPNVRFSISATTRAKRPMEQNGKDYYFIDKTVFEEMIANDELVEYEEIFGNYYGTLRSEIQKAIESDSFMLFDIDVKGALALKKAFPKETLLVFLTPLSIDVLENRLKKRATESEEQIATRIARAKMEIEQSKGFDFVIVNDVLEQTFFDIEEILKSSVSL